MASPEEIRRLLDQLDRAYRRLGETNPFSRQETDVRKLEDALRGVENRLDAINDDFGSIMGSINASLDAMSKTNAVLNNTRKFFRGIDDITRKLRDDQSGIAELNLKDLKTLEKKLNSKKDDLRVSKESLENKKNEIASQKHQLEQQQHQAKQEKDLATTSVARKRELQQQIDNRKILIRKAEEDLRLTKEAHTETKGFLEGQDSLYKIINDRIQARIAEEGRVNEALGLGGAAIDGMGKALDKMGLGRLKDALGLENVKGVMEDLAKKAAATGEEITFKDKLKVLRGGLREAGAQLISNLKDPLFLASFALDQLIKAFTSVDKLTGDMAKQMGVSYDESLDMVSSMTDIANLSGEAYINTQGMVESQIAISKSLGTSAMASGEMLKDFTLLTKQMNISAETATALNNITLSTGGDLSDNTKEILGAAKAFGATNKVALSSREILEGIKNISSATVLSLNRSPKALAETVAQAKALGLEMAQLEKIASSLLQFESSIESELEAELLTGQQLNFEQARFLALQGDVAGATAEVAKQLGSAADFSEMNVIQQEAIAKSVGLSRDELAKSLIEREALEKIGAKDAAAAKEQFDSLVERYGYEKAIKELGDEDYARQLASQSVQERFAAVTQKLQEIFVSIAEPVLQIVSPLMDLAVTILPLINTILQPILYTFKTIAEVVGSIVGFISKSVELTAALTAGALTYLGLKNKTYLLEKGNLIVTTAKNAQERIGITLSTVAESIKSKGFMKTIGEAAMSAYSSVAKIPFIGPILGVAAAAAALAYGMKQYRKADDMVSPGYGKRTILSPEGSIALNDNDTIIAGTNLGGGKTETASTSPSINIAPLVEQMNRMNTTLQAILAKEGTVELDGTKVGTALTVGSYKLQ